MDAILPDLPLAPRLVVGAAIVDDLERPTSMLAARRTGPPALAGGWELPGGKVEPGEDAVIALHREIREELGVPVELGREIPGPVDGAWPLGDRYVMRVWLARVSSGRPEPLEDHDLLRWVDLADAFCVSWLPADLPIVDAVTAAAS
jgi:8-oxo-dGTP diphosphatase